MQIYGSLSEEKKRALDVLMTQNCDQCEVGNPCLYCEHEFKAQADRNEFYNWDAPIRHKADGEYISKSDMIDWLKDIRSRIKPQGFHTASEFEIAENQIWNLIQMLQMGAFPTVAIPSVDMFSDLKAEISMYENSEQSIDEMIQGIKSIISIYER